MKVFDFLKKYLALAPSEQPSIPKEVGFAPFLLPFFRRGGGEAGVGEGILGAITVDSYRRLIISERKSALQEAASQKNKSDR